MSTTSTIADSVLAKLGDLLPDLEKLYTDIHSHPELSMQEKRTSEIAAKHLRDAGYDVTTANYRRVILTAMQEAEDGIVGLAALERASDQAGAAIVSARRVLDLATSRYEGGIATYLDAITAEQALLNAERLAAQLRGQRMLTAIFLVKALGGDWPGQAALAKDTDDTRSVR